MDKVYKVYEIDKTHELMTKQEKTNIVSLPSSNFLKVDKSLGKFALGLWGWGLVFVWVVDVKVSVSAKTVINRRNRFFTLHR